MVSDVIEFSTNQKAVNFFFVFQRYLGNGKEFLDEIFSLRSEIYDIMTCN